MAKKVRDYAKLAADIKDTLGESNILSAAYCATRLRLILKEMPADDITKKVEQMPGVIQVIKSSGQYQVVIGTHAKDVWENLSKIMTFTGSQSDAKAPLSSRILASISGSITPFLYILVGGGLIQGALILLSLIFDIRSTGAAQIYDMISWTPFTFLPAFIAVAAAGYFKCDRYIALWCCLSLTNPTWSEYAAKIASGVSMTFFGIPLTGVAYTSTVIPPFLLVAVLAVLERWLDKKLPDIIKRTVTPAICAVIMIPLTILVIGPLATLIANGLAAGYTALYHFIPWLASGVFAFFWQVFVIFSVHWSFTAVSMANYQQFGFDLLQHCCQIAVCAQAAACFGVFFKTRNRALKNDAMSATIPGLFGITEPAIYGVTLRFKRPFLCGCISGAVGAIIASYFNSRYFVFAGLSGFLTIPNAIYTPEAQATCEALGAANPAFASSATGVLIGTAVACILAFVLVQIIGFEDPIEIPEDEDDESAAAPAEQKEVTVVAPLNGVVQALESVPDPTFAGGILGQGIAILPADGKLYSPIDATVSTVADSKHAVGLLSDSGVEMLIHIGLETVELKGQYFTPKVKEGEKVKVGDVLIEFDIAEIAKKYKMVTPVLVTNADDCNGIQLVIEPNTVVKVGEPILTVKP